MKFTHAQEQAINTQNKTLLIAAGAGSGKTSVLTERIIRKICGDYDITDFLVVTFTRASANDLKNKIATAINKKLAENINNTHLKRQQILLGRARISTMHSFCLDLCKSNFEKLGIPAKFRIADENEADIIKRGILDKLLDDYYNADSPIYESKNFTYADFISALENFINSRDDENIYAVIFKIYDKILNHAEPFKIFDEQIELMREVNTLAFFKSRFGAEVRGYFYEKILRSLEETGKSFDIIRISDKLDKKYTPAFAGLREFFETFLSILNGGSYNNIYELCADYESVRIGSQSLKEDRELEAKAELDRRHKALKEEISDIRGIFAHDFEDLKRFAQSYEKILAVLKDFISAFDERLLAEKIHLKSFEFSDLERFALVLLVEKIGDDGEIFPTDLAKRLKESYREIYIDEYQDTNRLQDMIFKAMSTENQESENGNRFMVGDIKQSIYAFRGAKPHIFAGYSQLFAESGDIAEPAVHGSPQKIYLRENFRSTSGIISFINHIFANLFSEELGGVNYTGGEVLVSGTDTNPPAPDVTFALVEKKDNEKNGGDDDDNNSEIISIISNEAEYTALAINNLLENGRLNNGDKIMPGDITVLMRDYTHAETFAETLKKYNIACYTDRAKGFLNSAEIMLVTSLLRVIDNPARDIDLAGVLKSPVFNFSLDDLIYIKTDGQSDSEDASSYQLAPLFSRVRIYAEHGDLPELKDKCADFLGKLNIWRAKSRILPVDKFIWYIYRQTDIINKISRENLPAERKANLNLLYEYARKFEMTAFRGLYEFMNYINDVESINKDFEKAKLTAENSGTVRIMSVHKSKGLEFPVCIFANTGQKFSNKDYTQDLVASETQLYFNLKYKDEIGYEKTPFKKLCAEKIKKDSRSEEARILYVALTRAVEKLIITGSADNIGDFLAKNSANNRQSADSNLKWLTAILLNADGSNKTNINFNINLVSNYDLQKMIDKYNLASELSSPLQDVQEHADLDNLTEDELWQLVEYEQKIRHIYNFKYESDVLAKIPVKIAVSDLTDAEHNFDFTPLPRFLEEETGVSAALKGTATHLFMQFADFEYAEYFGAENEAANLLSRGFITDAQYERINFQAVDTFLSSDLYARIKNARKIYRETPFLLKVPVSSEMLSGIFEGQSDTDLSDSGLSNEYILIQGAIDLFFEDSDGKIYIVDFKTDYVRSNEGDKILTERHKRQLEYYCMAAGEISGGEIGAAYIYSFSLGRAVEVR